MTLRTLFNTCHFLPVFYVLLYFLYKKIYKKKWLTRGNRASLQRVEWNLQNRPKNVVPQITSLSRSHLACKTGIRCGKTCISPQNDMSNKIKILVLVSSAFFDLPLSRIIYHFAMTDIKFYKKKKLYWNMNNISNLLCFFSFFQEINFIINN